MQNLHTKNRLQFDSLVPYAFKYSLVQTLLFCALKLCSSYAIVHKGIQTLKLLLSRNRFFNDLIDQLIKVPNLMFLISLLFVLPYAAHTFGY